jgi:hypothetical protein
MGMDLLDIATGTVRKCSTLEPEHLRTVPVSKTLETLVVKGLFRLFQLGSPKGALPVNLWGLWKTAHLAVHHHKWHRGHQKYNPNLCHH